MARKMKKKYESGTATAYLSQKQAMRKLQIGLPNFRRLCILKGIYPVEPKSRKKAGKGTNQPKIYFYAKDIAFLAREPLLNTFRRLRVYSLKLRHARERGDKDKEFRLRMNKPRYSLHELVRERYPSREDAVHDMNDSLNLIFLFARLPRLPQFNGALITLSRRLSVEFLNYVVAMRAVRKCFISIKGYYIQAEIMGIPVVWIMPHASVTHTPSEVDYRILATCLEFDATLIGSLLCSLYKQAGLVYPPKLAVNVHSDPTMNYFSPYEAQHEYLSCLSYPIKKLELDQETVKDSDEAMEKFAELQTLDDQVSIAINKQLDTEIVRKLFEGKKFLLNREVPKDVLVLIIRSCGGTCSWPKDHGPGATFQEEDQLDYQIVDRPLDNDRMKVGRYYVQPQWLFDSVNAGRLMPAQDYMPGAELPAHLSPFALAVSETADASLGVKQRHTPLSGAAPGYGAGAVLYRPPEADYLAGLVSLAEIRGGPVVAVQEAENEADDKMDEEADEIASSSGSEEEVAPKVLVKPGKADTPAEKRFKKGAVNNAEKKLQEMSIPKKRQRLYQKMKHSLKEQNKEIKQLTEKRKNLAKKPKL